MAQNTSGKRKLGTAERRRRRAAKKNPIPDDIPGIIIHFAAVFNRISFESGTTAARKFLVRELSDFHTRFTILRLALFAQYPTMQNPASLAEYIERYASLQQNGIPLPDPHELGMTDHPRRPLTIRGVGRYYGPKDES